MMGGGAPTPPPPPPPAPPGGGGARAGADAAADPTEATAASALEPQPVPTVTAGARPALPAPDTVPRLRTLLVSVLIATARDCCAVCFCFYVVWMAENASVMVIER